MIILLVPVAGVAALKLVSLAIGQLNKECEERITKLEAVITNKEKARKNKKPVKTSKKVKRKPAPVKKAVKRKRATGYKLKLVKPEPVKAEHPDPITANHPAYSGSLIHYYDEAQKIECTLVEGRREEFSSKLARVDDLLCGCDPDAGVEIQKLVIALMTARNCRFGLSTGFPPDPMMTEYIFNEIQEMFPIMLGVASSPELCAEGMSALTDLVSFLRSNLSEFGRVSAIG